MLQLNSQEIQICNDCMSTNTVYQLLNQQTESRQWLEAYSIMHVHTVEELCSVTIP